MKPEFSPKIKLEHPNQRDGKTLLTFDCYGTLIDWEAGILSALQDAYPLAREVDEETLLQDFHSSQNAIKSSEYRKYRQLLMEVSMHVAKQNGWDQRIDRAEIVPKSIPTWLPFPDTNVALNQLADAGVTLGILSNIDNDLLAGTLEHFHVSFPFIATAEDLLSYKPASAHFVRGREWATEHQTWIHVAQSLFHDVEPASEMGIPVVWVNRKAEVLPSTAHPMHVVSNLAKFVEWFLSP